MPNEYNSELSPSKDIVERLRELSTWDMPELKYAATEIERLRKESEITPAQYWEAQASMWHENYKELKQADMLARRYREALENIAKGVHHGPRCHALARKALREKE